MWIVLNDAFLSCVLDAEQPGTICVRARASGDIARAFGDVEEVVSEPGRDYAYRAWVTPERLKQALVRAVDAIDYTNFKDSVEERDRHDAYLDVWSAMYAFQRERKRSRR